MPTLWALLNLAACLAIWAVAMFFYLRHGIPQCARHHVNQLGLMMLAVGAFAAALHTLKGHAVAWWDVLFRVGVALMAIKAWAHWWMHEREPRA